MSVLANFDFDDDDEDDNSSDEESSKAQLQWIITQKMRRVLVDELDYQDSEVDNMDPQVIISSLSLFYFVHICSSSFLIH